ncbi:unnamed protein product, partial [Musa acuminata var. zebrina]
VVVPRRRAVVGRLDVLVDGFCGQSFLAAVIHQHFPHYLLIGFMRVDYKY